MTRSCLSRFTLAAACVLMAGCASVPNEIYQGMTDLTLAAAHSDITFMLATGSRQAALCDEQAACQGQPDAPGTRATPFSLQVQRVAATLQQGARELHPDIARRIGGFPGGGFDVHVTSGNAPGSASSARGRIALNAALGEMHPYDDWLAFVIAREMGHVIARHHEENSGLSLFASLIMNILLPGSSLLKSVASTAGSQFAAGSNQREQTDEADAIAIKILKAAGFRLREVSLSLRVSAAAPDENAWSQAFRASSEKLFAEFRAAQFIAVSASAMPAGNAAILVAQGKDAMSALAAVTK